MLHEAKIHVKGANEEFGSKNRINRFNKRSVLNKDRLKGKAGNNKCKNPSRLR